MKKLVIVSLALCILHCTIQTKVLIFTHAYNRPDFIELQNKTFKFFLENDYEFVVFNDARDTHHCNAIEQICKKLNLRCIRVPQSIHNRPFDPGARHIDGIHLALNTIGFDHDGIVMLIDSDMFLIKPLNIEEYTKGYDIVCSKQSRSNGKVTVDYIAPTIVMMNMNTLPNKRTINFRGDTVEGLVCDLGGQMYYYFKNNPSIKIKYFPAISVDLLPSDANELAKLGHNEPLVKFIRKVQHSYGAELHRDAHFVHYYAGSNWPGYNANFLTEKTIIFNDFINETIKYYTTNK